MPVFFAIPHHLFIIDILPLTLGIATILPIMHMSELLLFMLALSGPASCATSGRPDGPFQLYAYGENVGGLVLFSDGGINHLLITVGLVSNSL